MNDKPTLPTSAEITRRLRIVSELRSLCLSLGRAKPVVQIDGDQSATSQSASATGSVGERRITDVPRKG